MRRILNYIRHGNIEDAVIEVFQSILPERHIRPKNKLIQTMSKKDIDNKKIDLVVGGSKVRKEITTKVILTCNIDNVEYFQFNRIKRTPYDEEVYSAISTLYETGNNIMTPATIYRAINGMSNTEFVSPQSIETVIESIDKNDEINISIDYTQEAKMYNKDTSHAKYEGKLLYFEKIEVINTGIKQQAYRILREPILYSYSKVSRQVINVSIELMNTKDAVRNTDEVIVIRGYLLRQIEYMKSKVGKRNNKIAYDSVYNLLNMLELDKKAFTEKTLRIRKHIKSILSVWKEQKYIKGYEEYKEGRTFKGITIKF